jgi:hypothetical protein
LGQIKQSSLLYQKNDLGLLFGTIKMIGTLGLWYLHIHLKKGIGEVADLKSCR